MMMVSKLCFSRQCHRGGQIPAHAWPPWLAPLHSQVYYGNWSTPAGAAAQVVLGDFVSGLSGSAYEGILASYTNAAKVGATTRVTLQQSASVGLTRGTALSDADVWSVVSGAIAPAGPLPLDANGVYLLLLDPASTVTSGLCTQYCAWHDYAALRSTAVKFGLIGNPERCPSACAEQAAGAPTPNDSWQGDTMANLIAHEQAEAITDPTLSAWYTADGDELADLCAWTFGDATYTTANGALANVELPNGRNYLIQQLWRKSTASGAGVCALTA
jgi:hypothetical protein